MPRSVILVALILILLIGGAFFLSSRAQEVPTRPVEIDVTRDTGTR